MRLLLVEDDPMLGKAVLNALRQEGYAVELVADGASAEDALSAVAYDAMVLDIGLPDKSGLEVLKWVRAGRRQLPVLMLTAMDAPHQRIAGLDAGADDYLPKPFDLGELLARLRALLRRASGRATTTIARGELVLDTAAKTVTRAGKPLSLSAREYAVLCVLLECAGRVVSRRDLEDKLYSWDMEVDSNAIEVHISHLRKKLGEGVIKTIRGLGYIVE